MEKSSLHRHDTPLRGARALPHPRPGDPSYSAINYAYAGREGRVHEVVEIGGRRLVKLGFPDRKIVYYLWDDIELLDDGVRRTFHNEPPPREG